MCQKGDELRGCSQGLVKPVLTVHPVGGHTWPCLSAGPGIATCSDSKMTLNHLSLVIFYPQIKNFGLLYLTPVLDKRLIVFHGTQNGTKLVNFGITHLFISMFTLLFCRLTNFWRKKFFEAFLKEFFMTNPIPSTKIFYIFPFKSCKRLNQGGP
jgi:hypothetical protein